MLQKIFTDHPASVDETYFQHLLHASWFATSMFIGAIVCLIHALVPVLFERTGSTIITRLYDRMVANRMRTAEKRSRA